MGAIADGLISGIRADMRATSRTAAGNPGEKESRRHAPVALVQAREIGGPRTGSSVRP